MLQAILFAAFGAIFLLTSARMKVKARVLWLFGLSVLVHAIAMTGKAHYPFFGNVLWVSGPVLFGLGAYMCYMIYVDLAHKRRWGKGAAGERR